MAERIDDFIKSNPHFDKSRSAAVNRFFSLENEERVVKLFREVFRDSEALFLLFAEDHDREYLKVLFDYFYVLTVRYYTQKDSPIQLMKLITKFYLKDISDWEKKQPEISKHEKRLSKDEFEQLIHDTTKERLMNTE